MFCLGWFWVPFLFFVFQNSTKRQTRIVPYHIFKEVSIDPEMIWFPLQITLQMPSSWAASIFFAIEKFFSYVFLTNQSHYHSCYIFSHQTIIIMMHQQNIFWHRKSICFRALTFNLNSQSQTLKLCQSMELKTSFNNKFIKGGGAHNYSYSSSFPICKPLESASW